MGSRTSKQLQTNLFNTTYIKRHQVDLHPMTLDESVPTTSIVVQDLLTDLMRVQNGLDLFLDQTNLKRIDALFIHNSKDSPEEVFEYLILHKPPNTYAIYHCVVLDLR